MRRAEILHLLSDIFKPHQTLHRDFNLECPLMGGNVTNVLISISATFKGGVPEDRTRVEAHSEGTICLAWRWVY